MNNAGKGTLFPGIFISLALFAAAVGCSVTPMRMNAVVEPGQVRKIEKVLIATNGRLFPDSARKMFFDPLVEAAMQMLQVHGVKSWQMEVPKQTLNPAEQMMAYARQLGASHVLHVAATSVASFGPRNSPVEYSKQQRLISSYELGFILIDVETKRNVWKGDLKSGTDYKGNEEEIQAVRSRLEEGLIQAGFLQRSSTAQSALKDPREITAAHFLNDNINTWQLGAQGQVYGADVKLDLDALMLPLSRGYGSLPSLHLAMSANPTLKQMVRELTYLPVERIGEAVESMVGKNSLWNKRSKHRVIQQETNEFMWRKAA